MAIVVMDEMMASWPSEAVVRLLLAHNARLEAEVAELKARRSRDSRSSRGGRALGGAQRFTSLHRSAV